MQDDLLKRLLVEIVVQAADSIESIQRFRGEVDLVKEKFRELVAGSKESFGVVQVEINKITTGKLQADIKNLQLQMKQGFFTGNQIEQAQNDLANMQNQLSSLKTVNQVAFSEMRKEMGVTEKATNSLGKTFDRVFRIGLGIIVAQVIGSFIRLLSEAVTGAVALSRSLLDIEVSARALERAGVDTTIKHWIDLSKELSTAFTQFTQFDINTGINQLIEEGRVAKLTEGQLDDLLKVTLKLATTTGQTMTAAANEVTTAIESGYARGLRKLLGPMDETTIAQEAIRRGMVETEEQVDATMRAFVILQVAQERGLLIEDDVITVQDSVSGKYQQVTNDIKDMTQMLGENLIPTLTHLKEMWLDFLTKFNDGLIAIEKSIIIIGAFSSAMRETQRDARIMGGALEGAFDDPQKFLDKFTEKFIELTNAIDSRLFNDLAKDVDNVAGSMEHAGDATATWTDELTKLYEDMRDTITSTIQDLAKEWRKYELDVAQAEEKFLQDQAQRYQDYLLDIAQAEQDFALSQKQAYEDYLMDVSQVNDDYNQSIADANEEYRKNEIKAEQDFQEDLRKLREQFLFDLEDALRERDAKQVLQLIRQYDLEKEQLARQRELEQDDAAQKLADDLANLEEEKNAKLQQMQEEFNLSQQQAQEKFNLEQQQRAESYALEQQQAAENYALLQKQREEDHLARLKEIEIQGKERLDALRQAFEDEYNLTTEQAKMITDALTAYFGPGGPGESAYKYLYEMGVMYTQALADTVLAMFTMLNSAVNALSGAMNPLPPYEGPNPNPPVAYATGGTLLATRPTVALFGEGNEPEIVQFTPLSKYKGNVNQLSGGIGGSSEQRIRLEVLLSPDLVSRVIDQSVGVVADVIEGKIL